MISKRTVLKVTAAGAVTAFSGFVPGLQSAIAQGLRVRRCVNTMALDDPDLATYRDFVGMMRDKSETERVSWVGFANQHGNEKSFKYCPHGDWYFLPWHRGFVQMYENAAAVLMKNPKFAMPYWDWTALRTLPAAFTDKEYKGKPNPLYVPGKGDKSTMKRNDLSNPRYALTDSLVGQGVMDQIYAETVFEVFGTSRNPKQTNLDPSWVPAGGGNQGTLERTPHNNVHNNIGGYMPQSNSPRDPIFMMHHGNIDRIWAYWNALGRKNSTDPLWLNMPFADNYITPDGKFYSRKVSDLLSTTALGYTYDNMPKADSKKLDTLRQANFAALLNPSAKAAGSKLQRFKMGSPTAAKATAALSMPVTLGTQALQSVVMPMTEKSNAAPREVVAIISDIKIGANVRAIRVFVNRDTVNQDVPDTDPNFVATLSFLNHGAGDEHAGHKALPSTIVDLTATLRKLSKDQKLATDKITVQLLPVPEPDAAPGSVGDVTPASIEIAIV